MSSEHLPTAEFAFPGPLRDKLVAAILRGEKTATTGLLTDYEHDEAPLPEVGQRSAVVDSDGQRVAVIETTAVDIVPVGQIGLEHARAEGEGFASVAEWRSGHEDFWHSDAMRAALEDPHFTVTEDTVAVAERFRVIDRLADAGHGWLQLHTQHRDSEY